MTTDDALALIAAVRAEARRMDEPTLWAELDKAEATLSAGGELADVYRATVLHDEADRRGYIAR